jgi:hypothetical protein
MFKTLFELVEHFDSSIGLTLKIYHSSIVDTCIDIGFKVTREQNITKYGSPFISVQSCDINKALAQAYDKLTDWLSENNGGY